MPKILVVDASPGVRTVVARALRSRRMEVVCAASGAEAIDRIEHEEPDVVLCDVMLPDRDGYQICAFVKEHPRLARTPVLLMSDTVDDQVQARAARVQSADVLGKPLATEDLLRRLARLLPTAPPSPHPVAPTRPEEDFSAPGADASGALERFAAIDGVQWVLLVDREGFLLDASGQGAVDAEMAGALGACLTESSERLGRELERGALHGMVLEYAQGPVVLFRIGASALLAVALSRRSALGKVRHLVERSMPELLRAV
jgi:CheY-like chemotaxis protein/predicted regulator of Ras-like GTPase activity (Roadblock/LC7/MglB family)